MRQQKFLAILSMILTLFSVNSAQASADCLSSTLTNQLHTYIIHVKQVTDIDILLLTHPQITPATHLQNEQPLLIISLDSLAIPNIQQFFMEEEGPIISELSREMILTEATQWSQQGMHDQAVAFIFMNVVEAIAYYRNISPDLLHSITNDSSHIPSQEIPTTLFWFLMIPVIFCSILFLFYQSKNSKKMNTLANNHFFGGTINTLEPQMFGSSFDNAEYMGEK